MLLISMSPTLSKTLQKLSEEGVFSLDKPADEVEVRSVGAMQGLSGNG
jgi:hypothetical protein